MIDQLESRRLLAAQPEILFVRGADRSGGFLEASNDSQRTEQLADIFNASTAAGNHGWRELRVALEQEGFAVSQIKETIEPGAPATGQTQGVHLDLETLDLSRYSAIVMGSNNATYDTAAVDALESYIRDADGAVLFISDANFGSSWADAPTSDQPFLSRFGLTVNQDQGTYSLQRSSGDFLVPNHPIFDGVNAFDGEGVSPLFVSSGGVPGVSTTLLSRAKNLTRINAPPYANPANQQGFDRPVTAGDASMLLADISGGRLIGYFDRNTFFNTNGAGSDITRFDNRTLALNLFNYLAFGPPSQAAPRVLGSEFRFEKLPLSFTVQFDQNVSASLDPTDVLVTNVTNGKTYVPTGLRYTSGNTAQFEFSSPLPNGNYQVELVRTNVVNPAGIALSSDFIAGFFVLAGDADRNRSVDIKDFGRLAAAFNRAGTFSSGDFDYDGTVTVDDFAILAAHFNQTLPA